MIGLREDEPPAPLENESPCDLILRPSHLLEQAPACESVSVAPSG